MASWGSDTVGKMSSGDEVQRTNREMRDERWVSGGQEVQATKVLISTSDSYNKKTILQLNCQKTKQENETATMWKFPQQNPLFYPRHVFYLTPRVWGLALLFTIRVAVHGSNFLIKAPQPSSKPPPPAPWDYLLGPEVQIGASEDSRWAEVIHGFPVGHTNKGKHSSWMPLLKSAATERKGGRRRQSRAQWR